MIPLIENFKHFMGKEVYRSCLMDGSLDIIPIELCRGLSLEDSFIIVDEAENCTEEQIDLMTTRVGKGSKLILVGDNDQTDLPNNEAGALEDFIYDVGHLEDVGVCRLTVHDIQRHPVVGHIINARREARKDRNRN